jgi:proteic killer suppression protein
MMEVDFADPDLDRLETDPRFTAGFGSPVVKGFRKVMQHIRQAQDERDLYASRGINFHRLEGNRSHQYAFKINDQWRLIVEIKGTGEDKTILVTQIEDYH